MTGGDVRLLHVPAAHLGNLPDILAHLGAELEIRGDGEEIRIRMRRRPAAIPYLATAPYPGFPIRSAVCSDGSVVGVFGIKSSGRENL